jgi:hypothetical protein
MSTALNNGSARNRPPKAAEIDAVSEFVWAAGGMLIARGAFSGSRTSVPRGGEIWRDGGYLPRTPRFDRPALVLLGCRFSTSGGSRLGRRPATVGLFTAFGSKPLASASAVRLACLSSSSRSTPSRAVNAEEALALRGALSDHAEKLGSTLVRQLALRIDSQIWDPGEGVRLSAEERRELLAAMEAARLGHQAHTRLSTLRSAIWTAELTGDAD